MIFLKWHVYVRFYRSTILVKATSKNPRVINFKPTYVFSCISFSFQEYLSKKISMHLVTTYTFFVCPTNLPIPRMSMIMILYYLLVVQIVMELYYVMQFVLDCVNNWKDIIPIVHNHESVLHIYYIIALSCNWPCINHGSFHLMIVI